MSENGSEPKLRNSVKRRRGDNAGEHFAFFRGAFVIGKQFTVGVNISEAYTDLHQSAQQVYCAHFLSHLCLQELTGKVSSELYS